MRLALLFLLALTPPVFPALAGERPNVLFIAVDDLNDWVGPLGGHPQAKTPHIKHLAARGTVFTSAHCEAPLCNPSRSSVTTGLRPSTTGIYASQPSFRTVPALKNLATLPQHFAKNGYRTLCTGKIFHDGMVPRADRLAGVEFGVWAYEGNNGPVPAKKLVETEAKTKLMDWGIFPERDEDVEDSESCRLELYDPAQDPIEWNNLIPDSTTALKGEWVRWIPENKAPPAPGSKSRLIDVRDGKPFWEGEAINTNRAPPSAGEN